MVCTKMTMLYEQYKTEWMVEHHLTMNDMIRELDNYRTECEQSGYEFNSIEEVMDKWEEDCGFGGEVWVCYDEWQDNEFHEELCDRLRDKARILCDREGNIIFFTPFKEITLHPDESHDDWGEVAAEFILYGDYAVNERDAKDERLRSNIIDWLWLNDEKGGAY